MKNGYSNDGRDRSVYVGVASLSELHDHPRARSQGFGPVFCTNGVGHERGIEIEAVVRAARGVTG